MMSSNHMLSAAFLAAVALCAEAACAAPPTANAPSWTSAGYNGVGQVLSQGYTPPAQAAGDTLVVNGEIITPGMTSVMIQYSQLSGGVGVAHTGAGTASSTAIGNSLNVSVQGSGDTVIVNSTQTTTAPVTAVVNTPK